MAAILKFKMVASPKSPNVIIDVIIMFIDPENIGIDTKSMPLRVPQTEILRKSILDGGHFEKWLPKKLPNGENHIAVDLIHQMPNDE